MINKRLLNCPSSSGDQGDQRTGQPARKPACLHVMQQPPAMPLPAAVSATDRARTARPPGNYVPMHTPECDPNALRFVRRKRLLFQLISTAKRGDSDTASATVLAPEENPTQVRVHKSTLRGPNDGFSCRPVDESIAQRNAEASDT